MDYKHFAQFGKNDIEMSFFPEWSDYINVLGHWKSIPSIKNLLKAYRKKSDKV